MSSTPRQDRFQDPPHPLAILGQVPAFAAPVHVGRPNLGNRQRLLERIGEMLDRQWLTNDGPLVQEFERSVANLVGARHCVAMCNGTVALEIAIRALGLTGEVLVPSYTFIATAHALQWQEITPVFCDITPCRHHLDPARLEERITPRTTGIIGVHLWGRPCEIDAILEIADRHRLAVLFDAAHALGCSYRGKKIGGFGRAEMFSFHATKFVNSFEGGVITTNDDELAQKMRLMRNFGFAGYDNVIYLGTNGKMSEISAAMGLTSLESMEEYIATNRRNHAACREGLAGLPGIRLLEYDAAEDPNYQYAVVEIDEAEAGLARDALIAVLHAENVLARRYFYPGCHRMEPYRSQYPEAGRQLPVTEQVAARVVVLPTGTSVGPAEIATICRIVRQALSQAEAVRAALAARA